MNLYLLFIILISLINIKVHFKKFDEEYLSKEHTTCIKGIFILLVFFSHAIVYMKQVPAKDGIMIATREYLGQLMVTMFLFYSGYGIYESIKKKKENYIQSIPVNRILKTLFHFDIAVLVFAITCQILKLNIPFTRILFAFTTWVGIGNSNWYITAILILYFITYLSFTIFKKEDKKSIAFTWILTALSMLTIAGLRGEGYEYCYNTMLCYPLGMTYSYYKEEIQKILFNNKNYILILITLILCTLGIKRLENVNTVYYAINATIFVSIVLLISMKVSINSFILKWFGEKLFLIYIFQRLPMMILVTLGYNLKHAYRFFGISFISTILIAIIFDFIFKILDKIIFKQKEVPARPL